MKTFTKGAIYSTIISVSLLLPSASFAQSWEPENVWKVDNTGWDNLSNSSQPHKITPYIKVETITSSERCKPITIKAEILDYTINQVFIYYTTGNLNYTMQPMTLSSQTNNIFVATLPETATQGDYIDYYIEAFNANKKLIATSGNAIAPSRIFMVGSCTANTTNTPTVNQPPSNAPDRARILLTDQDDQDDQVNYDDIFSKKTTSGLDNKQSPTSGNTAQPHTNPQQIQTNPSKRNATQTAKQSQENTQSPSTSNDDSYPIFQFSVMLGSAFGIVYGKTENCEGNTECVPTEDTTIYLKSSLASLPLHLRANAIFNLPKHFQVGIYIRGQLINSVAGSLILSAKDRIKNPAQYNIMVGLALRYLILWEQPYRLYFGLEFGWGGANATVDMGPNLNNYKDIYLYKGPWHIAPEIGFLWNFHKNFGLAVELTIPIVFPERPSAFFDLSIGPYFQF